MKRSEIIANIRRKSSFLCVGLDTAREMLPELLLENDDPIFEFNKAVIDATSPYCVAYKLNLAFYEREGAKGWKSLEKTLDYIPEDQFVIADAKRGDVGNTAAMYARTFFETYGFDAVTLSPYMGMDSIRPFLEYKDKWSIILGLTSNDGARDFQLMEMAGGQKKLWEEVIEKSSKWGSVENTMYVIGATRKAELESVRTIIPDHFLLVPGFGAQGGSLDEISSLQNRDISLLVNSSRAIIYAGSGADFAEQVSGKAREVQSSMAAQMVP